MNKSLKTLSSDRQRGNEVVTYESTITTSSALQSWMAKTPRESPQEFFFSLMVVFLSKLLSKNFEVAKMKLRDT